MQQSPSIYPSRNWIAHTAVPRLLSPDQELGLPVNPDIPLIAFIGRLDEQKGADLVLGAAPWMMEQASTRTGGFSLLVIRRCVMTG